MSDITEKEASIQEETADPTVLDASKAVAEFKQAVRGGVAKADQVESKATVKGDCAAPAIELELFIDPITVPVTLSEAQVEDHRVPKDFMYECVCYPHAPDADFEVVLPDGCRENMWTHVDDTTHDHSFLIFAISLRLGHMLIDENRHADIFPESARQDRLEEEAFEAKRAECRRTHPDASKQSMKVTLTAPSRRSESSEAREPGNGEAKKALRKELSGNTRKAPVREPFSIWSG